MVRLQIAERDGVKLLKTLIADMKSGKLRTLQWSKDKGRVMHNENTKTYMKWTEEHGVIVGEIRSSEGGEWGLLSSLVGRLADKYADQIQNIAIQFQDD